VGFKIFRRIRFWSRDRACLSNKGGDLGAKVGLERDRLPSRSDRLEQVMVCQHHEATVEQPFLAGEDRRLEVVIVMCRPPLCGRRPRSHWTGWAIGNDGDLPSAHQAALMDKLEGTVLPLFHHDAAGWAPVMKGAISKTGAVFTSHRVLLLKGT